MPSGARDHRPHCLSWICLFSGCLSLTACTALYDTNGYTSAGCAGDCDASTDPITEEASEDVHVTQDVAEAGAEDTLGDTTVEGATPKPLGESCLTDTECASNLCLTAPGGMSACSRMCCGSFECPSDTVCLPFFGANTCQRTGQAGLGPPGSLAVGAPCINGSECRSARCDAGMCVDVCCTDGNCLAGRACALWETQNPSLLSWQCITYPVGFRLPAGASCDSGNDCDSNSCISTPSGGTCAGPCCGDSDCGGPDDLCVYLDVVTPPIRTCLVPPGGVPIERPCCSDSECENGLRCIVSLQQTLFDMGTEWGMRCAEE